MVVEDEKKPDPVKPDPTPTPTPTPTPAPAVVTPVKKEPKSLVNLFEQAETVEEFFDLLFENFWVVFVWFDLGW